MTDKQYRIENIYRNAKWLKENEYNKEQFDISTAQVAYELQKMIKELIENDRGKI